MEKKSHFRLPHAVGARPPGSEAIDRAGEMPCGPEYLDRDLRGVWLYKQEFPEEAVITAFDAMAQVLAAEILKDPKKFPQGDPPPDIKVSVPLWALQVLASAWIEYRQECATPGGRTFGEIVGIEGRGQGRKRLLSREQTRMRDWGMSLEVAELHVEGITLDQAIVSVAEKYGLSEDSLRRIWKARPQSVKHYLQTRVKTSRSGDPDI